MKQLKYCKYDEEKKILVSNEPAAKFEKPVTFAHFLLDKLEQHGENPFLTDEATGATMTYRQARDTSLKIASSFIRRLGLERGDVVFGYAFTSPIYCCAVLACNLSNVIFTGQPARLSPVSLIPLFNDCKAKVVLCIKESLPRILVSLERCPSIKTIVLMDASDEVDNNNNGFQIPSGVKLLSMSHLVVAGDEKDKLLPRVPEDHCEDQLIFLPYSSGSTGLPKGVKRCADSMVRTCHNLNPRGILGGKGEKVSFYQCLGHTSGQFGLIMNVFHGCNLIVLPELIIEQLLDLITRYKIDCAFIPPTSIQAVAKMQDVSRYDLSSIKAVLTGGAPLVASVVGDFLCKFPNLDMVTNSYGLSEGMIATLTTDDADSYQSVGSIVRGVEVKIVDLNTKRVCSFGETGELWMRTKMSSSGYLNRPDAEAETWVEDGWVRTGDAGYYNQDGLVYIVDRYKEMIKVHINQVAPAELQAILALHPQVNEACVVAAPHPETGETPRAFVVPQDINNLPDEDELLRFVNDQVVEYRKINGGLFLVQSLPKIVIGKFNRQLVKKNPEQLVYLNPKRRPGNVL